MLKRKPVKYFSVALLVMLVCVFNIYSITSGMTIRNARILGLSTPITIFQQSDAGGRPLIPKATTGTDLIAVAIAVVWVGLLVYGAYQAGQLSVVEEVTQKCVKPSLPMGKTVRVAMLMTDLK
jgi:hypothetical protein